MLIPKDLMFHRVKLPGKGINLSIPTAEDGIGAVEFYAQVKESLINEGHPYDEAAKAAFYAMRLKYGPEAIHAVLLATGQEPLGRALAAGKIYRMRGTEYAQAETYEEIEHLEKKNE